jgi:uncharacterized phage protein (TIGR01671 family)|nr:MAG TPA: YopX protein [Caudoviricetes sp.]
MGFANRSLIQNKLVMKKIITIKMDRTIKFRGKRIYDEEWQSGSLVKIEKDRYAVIPSLNDIEIGKSIGMYEVCLETIGQFTGLYDKNGKEIYEGDILFIGNDGDKNIYNKVSIKDGCFGYIGEWNHKIMPFCYYNVTEEIAGNIYDNPELIKEE